MFDVAIFFFHQSIPTFYLSFLRKNYLHHVAKLIFALQKFNIRPVPTENPVFGYDFHPIRQDYLRSVVDSNQISFRVLRQQTKNPVF